MSVLAFPDLPSLYPTPRKKYLAPADCCDPLRTGRLRMVLKREASHLTSLETRSRENKTESAWIAPVPPEVLVGCTINTFIMNPLFLLFNKIPFSSEVQIFKYYLLERSLSDTLRPHRWCCQGTGRCSECSARQGALRRRSGGCSHNLPSNLVKRER